MTPAELTTRLQQLRDMVVARDGQAGYKHNVAQIRAEIARLEAENGQADRSGPQVDPA